MGTKAIMHLFLEMCGKDRSAVRDGGLWYTMIAGDVGNV
jgi:hypothetical protein